jgi:hypothetical protein
MAPKCNKATQESTQIKRTSVPDIRVCQVLILRLSFCDCPYTHPCPQKHFSHLQTTETFLTFFNFDISKHGHNHTCEHEGCAVSRKDTIESLAVPRDSNAK